MDAAEARSRAAAAALSAARQRAATSLEKKVNATMRELGFPSARLPIALEPRELGPTGGDRVRFLFAPNPGEEARPLAKIASGGELSRVMLAVKQALARTDEVLTYVFDEVDAGVGGGTAEVIGRKLKRLSRRPAGHRHNSPPPGGRLRGRARQGDQDGGPGEDPRRHRAAGRRRTSGRDRAHAGGRDAVGPGDRARDRDATKCPAELRKSYPRKIAGRLGACYLERPLRNQDGIGTTTT